MMLSFYFCTGVDMSNLHHNDQQLVKDLEHQFLTACLSADIEKLNHILADNFIFTDPYGLNMTKLEWLSGIKSGEFTFESIQLKDLEVHVSTNIAWARAEIHVKARSNKAGYDGLFSAMDIYEKQDDKWQIILSTANHLLTH
jgi:ketosteroid isomerase-like protein